jgi:nitrite reductase (NO-forming)
MSRTSSLLLVVTATLLLGACEGDAPTETEATPVPDADGSVDAFVVAGDVFFQPAGVEIAAGSVLVVHFSNEGALSHSFTTEEGDGTAVLAPEESETVELGPFDTSTVAFCTVDDHREQGMQFDISVTD